MAADEFSDYPDTGAEGSSEYLHPQDESIWFTNKNNHDEYEPPRPDADYGVGASGAVSVAARQGSGGGSAAPFIHPVKLEKVTDPECPPCAPSLVWEWMPSLPPGVAKLSPCVCADSSPVLTEA